MSSSTITLRPAQRSDITTLSHLANAGNANSAFHRRMVPNQDQYPYNYYLWRRNIIRQRFATPNLRTIVAVETSSGEILGQASWAVEGEDSALYQTWTSQSTWSDWLEGHLIWIEKKWSRYVTNKCVDYTFKERFIAGFYGDGDATPPRPNCLHCHMIVVDPNIQSKGVGRMLIDWGKQLAVENELPVYLEATLEATGFYEKIGFERLSRDLVVDANEERPFMLPVYVWEGEERGGHWLERDEGFASGERRWKWREDVLPERKS